MSILVSVSAISKSFAARPLFSSITFSIQSGERIALIGPNGAGKSTLMKILALREDVDEGRVSAQRGVKIGYLEQVPTFSPGATTQSALLDGIDGDEDWESLSRAQEITSKLSLGHPDTLVEDLSGGWKKRVALGRELMRQPDLLLLDEPTNHLDVESILWLEELLASAPYATLTISHDRAFLHRIANRILELDRRNVGGLLSVNGDYTTYLEVKEQLMASQERQEGVLKNTLRRETEWLRRGAKARTTKQQARIQRAGDLKEVVSELEYRNQSRTARLDFQSSEQSPKKLIEAKNISFSYGDRPLFSNLDLLLAPGKRVGLLGTNGCGKSTLIQVLLGFEDSQTGTVSRAENLSVAYFEQNRETLDPKLSVAKTICPSGDFVDYRGNRIHIRSYLDRFLFSQGQMDMAIGKLSGGEQSRVLLAKLMLNQANLLVLDEPTNDLDMATLNVLENCLLEFPGAILLVTHDRYFLDQVATQILAFGKDKDGDPSLTSYASLSQWESAFVNSGTFAPAGTQSVGQSVKKEIPLPRKKKLGFKEQRELDSMEGDIQKVEKALEKATAESVLPANLSNAKKLLEVSNEIHRLQVEMERLYARWAELESS